MNNHFRLSVFIFIFLVSLFNLRLSAQEQLPLPNPEATISMDFKDAELKDLLKAFSIQSGLNFIASEALQDRKITLYLDKVPVKEVMNKLFKANNLSYELNKGENIFIVKDWGIPTIETITKVFYLKHHSVSSSNLNKELQDKLSVKRGDIKTVLEGTNILSSYGKITEDSNTNSLIITDVPARFPIIELVIAKLDVPIPQVMLEVEMLDVTKDTVDKMGLKFGQSPITLNMLMQGASVPSKFPWGGLFGDKNKGITGGLFGINTGATNSAVSTYQIVLDFLRTQTDTKYLARPRLLTLNNETAEISITKDEIMEIKPTTESITPAGGGTPVTNVTGYDVKRASDLKLLTKGIGITLRVTPQINLETNEVTMVINPQASASTESTRASAYTYAIGGKTYTASAAEPEIRETKSIVKVKDGETVVLGGLIHIDKAVTSKKLPILGDIPILGAMFRHKDMTKDLERELLVFITPHIIKEGNIELAQAKKIVFPEREQSTVSGINRHAIINRYLNIFDKNNR